MDNSDLTVKLVTDHKLKETLKAVVAQNEKMKNCFNCKHCNGAFADSDRFLGTVACVTCKANGYPKINEYNNENPPICDKWELGNE